MQLRDILADVPGARLVQGDPATSVTGVGHDSRTVRPGELFVAMPGQRHDARHFVPQALERGAAAIVSEAPVEAPPDRAVVLVPSARAALADAAAAFHGHPSRRLRVVGVTGTDGKTTTTRLLAQILERAGRRVGWLTTVDVNVAGRIRPNDLHHTTPEADRVQAVLAEMVATGVEVAVLETSSHALSLDRVRGCAFDVAVFTNLSPEHLNFHGTLDEYRLAKARLFEMLGEPSHKPWPHVGVVNADDPSSEIMRERCPAPVRSYGIDRPADVVARDVLLDAHGAAFRLVAPHGEVRVATSLLGRFNVANWLAAATAAFELGATPEHLVAAAAELPPVNGRMERVDRGQPYLVVVDFSHTPQALENALRTLRPHTDGRLMVVFGHAGERDPANRPAMGRVAAELSDFFVISMDDPLHEDPLEIAEQIAGGARALGKLVGRDFVVDVDRAAAIRTLLHRARPGDTVLLAGKGHERRMLVGDERLPWNDREEAERALRELGYPPRTKATERPVP
ncbi:MAG: UDP-N-acetylmuramoyl-L-alanyl-D-glutamate--2,6-diaminopimelate ligase [Chloroflexota bacterium]|nr:UDP-N-acetylmuramoyl-L-alanyl-D-glutamate--2,6-diaminopimelate ligase [Chloroflexota bacterium]